MAGRSDWTAGMRLERAIYDAGMSKEEVANRSGLGRTTVFKMCDDRPAMLSSWCAVARALGMDPIELIGKCLG